VISNDLQALDWDKGEGLLPVIVQHYDGGAVLMLGYMTPEALAATRATGRVTFFSRARQRLWTKGETSGHFLEVRAITADCDGDTLLILAKPLGPVCHLGTATCFGSGASEPARRPYGFLETLSAIIRERIAERPPGSYTAKLLDAGPRRIAQKVGEEGLELALAAVAQTDEDTIAETADLLYHVLLLLESKGLSLAQVVDLLEARHAERRAMGAASGSGGEPGP
jgi:phosphoribosyl-AMP cyclohydrolase / phosphoribosyl-ATP pyrophosphohydrolase